MTIPGAGLGLHLDLEGDVDFALTTVGFPLFSSCSM